ncbi:hypothetical protein GQ42DRAFT_121146, partial [Ramicandelaber brevisporus]
MSINWTENEVYAGRRLVHFTHSKDPESGIINCIFNEIMPEQRKPGQIIVSCIYWPDKNDYFITSVDLIMLLESLIGLRFSVEEKNRIRRNLEGFRPLTVSKTKMDSQAFFRTIMNFPNPKPRNIEKDVKVFPWRVLGNALKKIIGKH